MAINWAFFGVSLVLQVVITIVFVTTFFFTYVSTVEKSIVVDQVEDVVRDLNTDSTLFLSDDIIQNLRTSMKQAQINTSADKNVIANNTALKHKVIIQLIIIGVVGLIIVVGGAVWFKLDARELLLNCVVSLIAVFITEFTFATFFAKNYKTLDENMIKSKIIQALQTYSLN